MQIASILNIGTVVNTSTAPDRSDKWQETEQQVVDLAAEDSSEDFTSILEGTAIVGEWLVAALAEQQIVTEETTSESQQNHNAAPAVPHSLEMPQLPQLQKLPEKRFESLPSISPKVEQTTAFSQPSPITNTGLNPQISPPIQIIPEHQVMVENINSRQSQQAVLEVPRPSSPQQILCQDQQKIPFVTIEYDTAVSLQQHSLSLENAEQISEISPKSRQIESSEFSLENNAANRHINEKNATLTAMPRYFSSERPTMADSPRQQIPLEPRQQEAFSGEITNGATDTKYSITNGATPTRNFSGEWQQDTTPNIPKREMTNGATPTRNFSGEWQQDTTPNMPKRETTSPTSTIPLVDEQDIPFETSDVAAQTMQTPLAKTNNEIKIPSRVIQPPQGQILISPQQQKAVLEVDHQQGRIQVRMLLQGEALQIQFHHQEASVGEMLERDLPLLKQQLTENGFDVKNIEIGNAPAKNFLDMSSQQQRQKFQWFSQSNTKSSAAPNNQQIILPQPVVPIERNKGGVSYYA